MTSGHGRAPCTSATAAVRRAPRARSAAARRRRRRARRDGAPPAASTALHRRQRVLLRRQAADPRDAQRLPRRRAGHGRCRGQLGQRIRQILGLDSVAALRPPSRRRATPTPAATAGPPTCRGCAGTPRVRGRSQRAPGRTPCPEPWMTSRLGTRRRRPASTASGVRGCAARRSPRPRRPGRPRATRSPSRRSATAIPRARDSGRAPSRRRWCPRRAAGTRAPAPRSLVARAVPRAWRRTAPRPQHVAARSSTQEGPALASRRFSVGRFPELKLGLREPGYLRGSWSDRGSPGSGQATLASSPTRRRSTFPATSRRCVAARGSWR